MDQQIRIGDLDLVKSPESSSTAETYLMPNVEEGNASDHELHPDVNSEFSDAATLEQRRAYKIELQVSITCLRGQRMLYHHHVKLFSYSSIVSSYDW